MATIDNLYWSCAREGHCLHPCVIKDSQGTSKLCSPSSCQGRGKWLWTIYSLFPMSALGSACCHRPSSGLV